MCFYVTLAASDGSERTRLLHRKRSNLGRNVHDRRRPQLTIATPAHARSHLHQGVRAKRSGQMWKTWLHHHPCIRITRRIHQRGSTHLIITHLIITDTTVHEIIIDQRWISLNWCRLWKRSIDRGSIISRHEAHLSRFKTCSTCQMIGRVEEWAILLDIYRDTTSNWWESKFVFVWLWSV